MHKCPHKITSGYQKEMFHMLQNRKKITRFNHIDLVWINKNDPNGLIAMIQFYTFKTNSEFLVNRNNQILKNFTLESIPRIERFHR